MAIEDAAALAICLRGGRPLVEELIRYAAARRKRAARVASLSIGNRTIYQMSGPLALARDAALRVAPGEALLRRMDWLYGGA
jgi:salicylate hydroxylase